MSNCVGWWFVGVEWVVDIQSIEGEVGRGEEMELNMQISVLCLRSLLAMGHIHSLHTCSYLHSTELTGLNCHRVQ